MQGADDGAFLPLSEAEDLMERAFVAHGVPEETARSVARALVAAEAEGQVGHGFSRLGDYIAQVKTGKVIGHAMPVITRPKPAIVHVDAGFGFAYPAMEAGIDAAVETAQDLGAAFVAIHRSHHCGALSLQVERAAKQGVAAMMVANSPPAIAPWGARDPLFGTNPIAFAAPRAKGAPLVIDLSLSVVARGKVMNAHKAGADIPEGWALDAEGRPTTDPKAALDGSMVPIGGAKGTALALMVEVLSAAMTGANFSADAGSFFSGEGARPGVGQFITLWSPPEGADRFGERMETLLGRIAEMEGTRLPGARRAEAIARALSDGVFVPKRYLELARDLAAGG
ncbi:Ldh family oxidoreductase [Cognatishimia sp. F0-27]|uniref:Ldh family oxidoreductase n=1 Tax=Cognatishimia sp. F0-27 TaxID=2816855 RepID=UPI001D0C5F8F|nr:Ldh family oxidoreductase [Cognatishimia sp. F0-27]MCC1492603.1 Ldh family oxidoreductase [Cognatishimia sp. F0-27]